MQLVRAGAGDCVEQRSHGVAEFRRKSVVHGLHFLNPCLRNRKQANTSAVALNVIASVELGFGARQN
jgi:hypothetical protein